MSTLTGPMNNVTKAVCRVYLLLLSIGITVTSSPSKDEAESALVVVPWIIGVRPGGQHGAQDIPGVGQREHGIIPHCALERNLVGLIPIHRILSPPARDLPAITREWTDTPVCEMQSKSVRAVQMPSVKVSHLWCPDDFDLDNLVLPLITRHRGNVEDVVIPRRAFLMSSLLALIRLPAGSIGVLDLQQNGDTRSVFVCCCGQNMVANSFKIDA
jgi:hypothetical protein